MDLSRLRLGELVAGFAAVALLVVLFLDWNIASGTEVVVAGEEIADSGWASLGVVMVLLLVVLIGLAFALVVTTASKRPAAIPIGAAVLTAGVGIIVTLVLLVRLLFLDDSQGAAYLGLFLCALIPVGGWIAMADERTRAPYSAAPDIEPRPAPPATA